MRYTPTSSQSPNVCTQQYSHLPATTSTEHGSRNVGTWRWVNHLVSLYVKSVSAFDRLFKQLFLRASRPVTSEDRRTPTSATLIRSVFTIRSNETVLDCRAPSIAHLLSTVQIRATLDFLILQQSRRISADISWRPSWSACCNMPSRKPVPF